MGKDHEKRLDIHNSDVPVLCRSCEARHQGVCAVLSPDQLQHLSRQSTKSVHAPKSDLHTHLTAQVRYANVLSGVVKLTKTARDGRQQIVGLQFAPDFLGRDRAPGSDTQATASTNVRLCSFPASALDDLVAETPELERRIHQQTVAELDEARDWLFALGRKTAPEKVASFLLLIATHANPERDKEEGFELELPLKRAEMADFLGLTTETVSRQMTNLRSRGVIDVIDRGRIRVESLTALKSEAHVDTH